MKQRSKVIATSIATIAMCASLAVGGTYALFTSESEVNIAVTAGTVDVRATASELTLSSKGVERVGNTFAVGGTATKEGNEITIDRMVPMDSVNFDIEIENYSNVNVQYRTVISVVEDTGLFSALTVTFTENGTAQVFNGGYAYADWAQLVASDNDATTADDVSTINVNIEFPNGENQNGYQGKSCKLAVTVEAVQGNADVVNPVTQTGERSWDVNNEEGMMLMKGIIDSNAHGEGRELNFLLTDNMDMTGYAWNMLNVWMTNIDGNGKTVSNVTCGSDTYRGWSGFVSYFGGGRIKDLTLENVTAVGSQAGIVAGHADGGWMENVTIKGTNTVTYQENPEETWGGVGAIAGVSTEGLKSGSAITIAEGATVGVDYNGILTESPYANEYAFINDISEYVTNNGTITTTGEWGTYLSNGLYLMSDGSYAVTNANGLKYFSAKALTSNNNVAESATIRLLNDIDMQNADFSAIITQRGDTLNFNGNGYTISNVNVISGENDNTTGQASLFYCYPNSTLNVSNLVISNITATTDMDGSSYGAAVVGYAEGTVVLNNVDVINAKVYGAKSSGVFVGHLSGSLTATDCNVTNSSVTLVEFSEEPNGHYAGKVIGTLAGLATLTDCEFDDVTIGGNLKSDNIGYIYGRKTTAGSLTQDGYTDLPTAKVEELDVSFFNDMFAEVEALDELGVEVDFGMDFVATETSADIQDKEYKDYMVDFEITFSQDIFVGNVILMGYYESFEVAAGIVALSVADEHGMVKAGTYRVMDQLFGMELDYEFIVETVQQFKCGVIMCDVNYDKDVEGIENANGEQITNTAGTQFVAPANLVITLELVMYEDNSYTNGVKIGDTITYAYDGESPIVDYSVMCELLSGQF